MSPADFNLHIKERLSVLDQQYILLDAVVVGALLLHEELLPLEWKNITDAEGFTNELGSIGFYGTQFFEKEDTDKKELTILTPFFNKGFWVGQGCGNIFIRDLELEEVAKNNLAGNLLKYAAVYPLS